MREAPKSKPLREERRPAREEVDEVSPGVLRIQLPISMPGLGHVNCYAMEDARGVCLVDPGLPGPRTWSQLKSRLAGAGLSIDRVHTVVITHSHPDHFGQAAKLQKKVGAEIVTHESFRTFLDPTAEELDGETHTVFEGIPPNQEGQALDPSDQMNPARLASAGEGPFARNTPWGGKAYQLPIRRRLQYWAMRKAAGRFMSTPTPTKRVEEAQVLELGGREWISVHTPGHTQDHLCLWDPANGIMISGDHVLPTITPHISGMSVTPDPLADFFTSLDRMQTFDGVSTVLPAHGLEFVDLGGRAQSIKSHHHDRLASLREASDRVGRGTVEEYMKELFQPRSWGSMAESETYAHLEHLRLAKQAAVTAEGHELLYEILG
ncbi:MAG: MBL fold metallo-hydrolase [Actinomycetia bacterium]|nr:MBL fold metallo-hydrolase [Actinomycetes bacterium]